MEVVGPLPPPPHSWEETPPIESTEAECAGLNKAEAKGFVSGSPPSSIPRVPGNQVGLLDPACGAWKTQRLLYVSASWRTETAMYVRFGGIFHTELFTGLRTVACYARIAFARLCVCCKSRWRLQPGGTFFIFVVVPDKV